MSDYREPTAKEWKEMKEMAKDLIASGFLPKDVNTIAKVMAIMLAGRELGIPTMQALRSIQVVKGKPSVAPELMVALAYQKVPGFRLECIESNDKIATFEAQRPGIKPYRHSFTIEQAKRAGLLDKKVDAEYNMWAKYTETMLRWRCTSAILKIVAPDAVLKLYTPEELGADIDEDGAVVAEPEPAVENTATAVQNTATAVQNTATEEDGEYEEEGGPNIAKDETRISQTDGTSNSNGKTVAGGIRVDGVSDGTEDHKLVAGTDTTSTGKREETMSPAGLDLLRKQVEKYKPITGITCISDVLKTDAPKSQTIYDLLMKDPPEGSFTLNEGRMLYALLQKQPATAKKPKAKAATPAEPQPDGQKCSTCGTFVSLSRAVDSRNVYYKILCQECEAKEGGQ